MRLRAAVAVMAAVVTLIARGQAPSSGEIAGRISDAGGGGMPGVRVTTRLGTEAREAVTDPAGRFTLPALPLGSHEVTVELPGFRTRSGTLTLSAVTHRAYLEWTLEVGCIEEVQRVILSARDVARLVHAIVHVRAEADHGSLIWSNAHLCSSVRRDFAARVVAASPDRRGGLEAGAPVRLIGEPRLPGLVPGREYVVLLWRSNPHSDLWEFWERQVLPVVDGVLRAPREPELDGLPVTEALATLGRWSTAPGRSD